MQFIARTGHKNEYLCIYIEDLEKRNNNFCIGSSAIFFLGLNLQTIDINLVTFGNFKGASHIAIKFHDILGFEYIFLDVANISDIYQPILMHKRNKMTFLTFVLIK